MQHNHCGITGTPQTLHLCGNVTSSIPRLLPGVPPPLHQCQFHNDIPYGNPSPGRTQAWMCYICHGTAGTSHPAGTCTVTQDPPSRLHSGVPLPAPAAPGAHRAGVHGGVAGVREGAEATRMGLVLRGPALGTDVAAQHRALQASLGVPQAVAPVHARGLPVVLAERARSQPGTRSWPGRWS